MDPNKLPVAGWVVDVAPKALFVPKAGVVIWKPVLAGLFPKRPFALVDAFVPKPKAEVVCVDPRPNVGLFWPNKLFYKNQGKSKFNITNKILSNHTNLIGLSKSSLTKSRRCSTKSWSSASKYICLRSSHLKKYFFIKISSIFVHNQMINLPKYSILFQIVNAS